ncbi:MAG: MucR family transcriptional regulator [Pseudomonadota bacterium]
MAKSELTAQSTLLEYTAQIVASHVANNPTNAADLPRLIAKVHAALLEAGSDKPAEPERPEPAVPIKKSITPDYIVCLEDGKKLKMLKRHLKTAFDLTPEAYRERWGLPADYPMVAPNYAKRRSKLAKKIGLGRQGRAASN